MNRKTIIAGATVLACLAAPAAASADTYLSRGQAERATRQIAHERYTVERGVGAYCELPGGRAPARGYAYRRWSCTWAAESESSYDTCYGTLKITGAPGWGNFRWSVARGIFGC